MIKKFLSLVLLSSLLSSPALADEGMWLLTMLKAKSKDMKKHGLKLKAKDIYNINKSSLKDAVCTLDHGSCTGEMISSSGLMLTNHHCGYGAIQQFSTEEHDYLTDGFWAMNKGEELHVPGMSVTFLVRVEDVTVKVLEGFNEGDGELARLQTVEKNKAAIIEEALKDNDFEAEIKSFYDGNEYYLFINQTFTDIRLVGAPPSSVGKYGGDTDNWMWPRHTGDFSMFRVYANQDNKPAKFSALNVPYMPKHHLPINISGVQHGDYAMVMGYPGSTDRYLTSYGVKLAVEHDQPARVKIRGKKLELMKADMDKSDKIRIQYASKYAQVSNYWKYFIGQSEQLVNNKVFDKKKTLENEFQEWAAQDPDRTKKYGSVMATFEEAYKAKNKDWYLGTYVNEAVFGADIVSFMYGVVNQLKMAFDAGDENAISQAKSTIKEAAGEFFKDYNASTDENIFAAMMAMYSEDVPAAMHPEYLTTLNNDYKGDWEAMAIEYYANSIFTNEERLNAKLDGLTKEELDDDKVLKLVDGFISTYRSVAGSMEAQMAQIKLMEAQRLFADGLRKMDPKKVYSPNANSTLRLSYGNVGGYFSNTDGVYYHHQTNLKGVIDKKDNSNPEFVVPDKLETLYDKKDFGRYGVDGKLPVCFISNNDITGGNSGSPVINAKGHLIGCAFDGNWEAMSGDIYFEDELQRTISVDIRYILFTIEKYAGAKHLVDEMTIIDEALKPNKYAKKPF